MEPNITDWISAISSLIVAIGVGITALSVYLASKQVRVMSEQAQATGEQVKVMSEQAQATGEQVKVMLEQIEKDQERSRREAGINLVKDWVLFIGTQGAAAKAIAEKLSPEDSRRLWNTEEVIIPAKHERLVKKFFDRVGDSIDEEQIRTDEIRDEKNIKLTSYQVHELRRETIAYLNMLEVVLSAKRHQVADETIIKEEFLDLVVPSQNRSILSEFRKAAGISTYPAIEEFVREMENDRNALKQGKDKL